MRIAVVSGRDFTAADRAGSQPVVILGAGAARKLFPDGDAVGHTVVQQQMLRPRAPQSPAKPLLVVGVAADPTYGTLVDGMTGMFVYVPLQQQYRAGWTNLVVRTRADSAAHDVRAGNPHLNLVHADGPGQQTAPVHDNGRLFNQRIAEVDIHRRRYRQRTGRRRAPGSHSSSRGGPKTRGVDGQFFVALAGMVLVDAGAVGMEDQRTIRVDEDGRRVLRDGDVDCR